ncbi:MAG: hypothetical protein ACRCV7_03620 [Culicoidibacterales bacterium]
MKKVIEGNNIFSKSVLTIDSVINELNKFVNNDEIYFIVVDVMSLHKNVKLNSLRIAILKEFENLSVYYSDDEVLILKNIFDLKVLNNLNNKYLKMIKF